MNNKAYVSLFKVFSDTRRISTDKSWFEMTTNIACKPNYVKDFNL